MADDPFLAKIAFLDLSIFNLVMTTLDGSMPTCTDAPVKINAAVQIRGERKKTQRQQTMMMMVKRARTRAKMMQNTIIFGVLSKTDPNTGASAESTKRI